MTKFDFKYLLQFFKCPYMTVEIVHSFYISNISTAFFLITDAPSWPETVSRALICRASRAGLLVACLPVLTMSLTDWQANCQRVWRRLVQRDGTLSRAAGWLCPLEHAPSVTRVIFGVAKVTHTLMDLIYSNIKFAGLSILIPCINNLCLSW